MMRLNKYIAHYSTYSRREADQAILDGYVRIDGEIEKNPAISVDERNANVSVSGVKITVTDQFTVIVYNKPRGELVTKKDPQKRRTIYDTLSKNYKHFIPVGRLDFASEGLLLMTDASRVATALMTSKMERVYRIKIKGNVTDAMKVAMGEGLELDDASAGAHEYADAGPMSFAPFYAYQIQKDQGDYSILKVAIGEGQNRELRRFFAHFGAEIVDLKRLSFGGIELNNLPAGKVRFLERAEYTNLHKFLETIEKADKMKQKDLQGKAKQLHKPIDKPVVAEVKKSTKREFVKAKKTKPTEEFFGTNKYKPKSDNKFKK